MIEYNVMKKAICKNVFSICVLIALVGKPGLKLTVIGGNGHYTLARFSRSIHGYSSTRTSIAFSPILAVQIATISQGPGIMTTQAESCGTKDVIIERVTDAYGLSEGPHWDHRTQKLYFVDIYNQYIRRLDPATGVVTSAYIASGTVGVVVPVDDAIDQLVAGGKDLVLVTWNGDSDESEIRIKLLCTLESAEADTRINDGKVDSAGRYWIGTMGTTTHTDEINLQIAPNQGTLYRINDTLKPEKKITPVSISNGLAWNIEDDTFYYIDSPTRQIAAYDYDSNSGTISNRRIVFDLNKTDLKGVPDGMTIDTDGNLWIALFGGHHLVEVWNDPGTIFLKCIKLTKHNKCT